ncbi:MAG: hypothetical protein KDA93_01445 [Planctomycetaceae bacterium]|nr:hypothetical protein [Planctomycetaceae bacterium]
MIRRILRNHPMGVTGPETLPFRTGNRDIPVRAQHEAQHSLHCRLSWPGWSSDGTRYRKLCDARFSRSLTLTLTTMPSDALG